MKKIILLCVSACFVIFPCVSMTSGIETTQPETVQVEQKASGFNIAKPILVKRAPKTTEIDGTWMMKDTSGENFDFWYFDFSGSYAKLKFGSENEYYVGKGTFSIKKDGSVRVILSKFCLVIDGVNKMYIDTAEYSDITNIPDRFNFGSYSINGDTLILHDKDFIRYTDDVDWRIFN